MSFKSARTAKIVLLIVFAGVLGFAAYFIQGKLVIHETHTSPGTNLAVFSPKPNETISSPVLVEGIARAFASGLVVRLAEKSGKVLFEQKIKVENVNEGEFGPFSQSFTFPKGAEQEGVLEVLQTSPQTGLLLDKARVAVRFKT